VAVDYALAFEVNRALMHREDLLPYFADLSRVDPGLFVRLLASAADHDAAGHLPDVRVPTLVVAGVRDSFTPMHLSVAMHQAIPGSELLVLPGGTHVAPLEHPQLVEERIRAFLAARVPIAKPARRPRRSGTPSPARPRAVRPRRSAPASAARRKR
jgi:pimeloyl-ACP methyl ester carboxylesterase